MLVLGRTTGKELPSTTSDAGPTGILLDAPRKRLYVTNREGCMVTAYNNDTYKALAVYAMPAPRTAWHWMPRRTCCTWPSRTVSAMPRAQTRWTGLRCNR